MVTTEQSNLVTCGCGKQLAPHNMPMHETSQDHRTWAATQPVPVPGPVVEPLDEEQLNILNRARAYPDPREVAKAVRALFSRRNWPDEEHLGTVADWLVEHNIPTIDLLPHMTPDDARVHVAAEVERFRLAGWGKTWEIK